MEIIPAILTDSKAFSSEVSRHFAYTHTLHIDIQDSTLFTGTVSLPPHELPQALQQFKGVWDIHYMSRNAPELETVIACNPRYVFLHKLAFCTNHAWHKSCALAVSGADTPSDIESMVKDYNPPALLILTVEAGKQGGAFHNTLLPLIPQLRKGGYKHNVFIDGAINPTTLPEIKPYLPYIQGLCVGSYLQKTGEEGYKELLNLLRSEHA